MSLFLGIYFGGLFILGIHAFTVTYAKKTFLAPQPDNILH